MSDSAKRNKISPLSLFYILFICRIVVSLTSVHSVSTTEINSQALISFVIAMVMTVVFSLPAVLDRRQRQMCIRDRRKPFFVFCFNYA